MLRRYHPFGILVSKHPDHDDNAWLILSRQALPPEAKDWIESGSFYDELYYLAAPLDVPSTFTFDPHDARINFFLNFGGLRLCPPFQAGHFYRFPMGPAEIEPGEWEKFSGTEWEEAEVIYVSDVGDELLVGSKGTTGWLLHESRTIRPLVDVFDDLLCLLSNKHGLYAEAN